MQIPKKENLVGESSDVHSLYSTPAAIQVAPGTLLLQLYLLEKGVAQFDHTSQECVFLPARNKHPVVSS